MTMIISNQTYSDLFMKISRGSSSALALLIFYSSSVTNDEFSRTIMEQCTLDAIGVLIISPTAGGGGLGRIRCNVHLEGDNIAPKFASIYLSR